MKKIRKISSMLVMAMLLFVSSGLSGIVGYAAENNEATNDSTANIVVDTENKGDVLGAYKVVDVTINENGVLDYAFTETFNQFKAQQADLQDLTIEDYILLIDNEITDENNGSTGFKTILGQFKAYVLANDVEADDKLTTNDEGEVTFTNAKMGQYIIVGEGNEDGAIIYNPVTANITPEANANGRYVLKGRFEFKMKNDDYDKEDPENPWDDDQTTNNTKTVDKKSAKIDEELTYTLKAVVPTYPEDATNTTFFVRDTLSAGITLDADSVEVEGLEKGTDYTVIHDTKDGKNILYVDFIYGKIRGKEELTVTYNAKLNENAVIEGEGNLNTYELIYSNSPYEGGTFTPDPNDPDKGIITDEDGNPIVTDEEGNPKLDKDGNTTPLPEGEDSVKVDRPDPTDEDNPTPGYGSTKDTETVFTYALIIDKFTGAKDGGKRLAGATFEIYENEELSGDPLGTITTNTDGYAAFVGLAEKTYYLKETKAPAGYKLADTITVAISDLTDTKELSGNANTDQNIMIGKSDLADHKVTGNGFLLPVENNKGTSLPSTGGMGTKLFTIIGLTLMAGTAVILITKKRVADTE